VVYLNVDAVANRFALVAAELSLLAYTVATLSSSGGNDNVPVWLSAAGVCRSDL